MIYLEDIIELIEDVPDELQRRGGLIQDWERQASEYKKEADKLTARLHSENNLRDDEKANIFRQIAESLKLARDVTQKKSDMAAKCHRLLQALSERVNEYAYHCKLELEVDAPGCTQSIENTFVQEKMMEAAAAVNNSRVGQAPEFRVPEEKQFPMRDRVGSSSISRESTPYGREGGGGGGTGAGRVTTNQGKRTRDSSMNSSRASSTAPFDLQQSAAALQQQRKRKRDRQREKQLQRDPTPTQQLQHRQQQREGSAPSASLAGGAAPIKEMSSYMRKKMAREREREREMRKLREVSREVHANRERTSQQRAIKPEPYDDGYETHTPPPPVPVRARVGRPPGSRLANLTLHHQVVPVRRDEPERREELEEPFVGGMSDADDDDLLKFLNDEMPGGMADHEDLNLGLEDENLFDMASFGADLGKALEKIQKERPPSPLGHNIYGTLNAPTKSSAAGPSRYTHKNPSKADLKRQQSAPRQYVSFSGGESYHGRQRRMTHRADIFSLDLETKEKRRRQKEEEGSHGEYSGYGRESRGESFGDDMYAVAPASQEDDSDNLPYCFCHMPSDGTMVGCEGDNCPYGGWFHLYCLNMSAPPAVDKWYCYECRKQQRPGSSTMAPTTPSYTDPGFFKGS